jgi:hypothetical protein
MNKRILLFICVLTFLGIDVYAQREVNKDAATWLELTIEKKVSSGLEFGLNQQFRINYNMSELGRLATELSVSKKVLNNVKLSGGYVLLNNRNVDDSYILSHRFFASSSFETNWNLFELQYRLRYQQGFIELGELTGQSIRNKFQVRYTLNKRLKPFVSYEIFYRIRPNEADGFNSERVVLGCSYKINRQVSLEAYYLYRNELNATNETDRDYVYGLKALLKL